MLVSIREGVTPPDVAGATTDLVLCSDLVCTDEMHWDQLESDAHPDQLDTIASIGVTVVVATDGTVVGVGVGVGTTTGDGLGEGVVGVTLPVLDRETWWTPAPETVSVAKPSLLTCKVDADPSTVTFHVPAGSKSAKYKCEEFVLPVKLKA